MTRLFPIIAPVPLREPVDPAGGEQHRQRHRDRNRDRAPGPETAGDAKGCRNPDSCRRGEALDVARLHIAQDHARADEADPGHDALDDTLHDAAQRIGVLGYSLHLDAGDGDRGGPEGDKSERAHADRSGAPGEVRRLGVRVRDTYNFLSDILR